MAATLTQAQAFAVLRRLGWRIRTTGEGVQVVRYFQRGWNLGAPLAVDGVIGPKTSAALRESLSRHNAGKGDASEHFSFSEFACKCGGRYSSCPRIWIYRGLLSSLEKYRDHEGGPVRIVSGCRCPSHNSAVGGVIASQHKLGTAADIHSPSSWRRVASWGLFAGLGYAESSGEVRHADRRDLTTRSGTLSHPTVWRYSQW